MTQTSNVKFSEQIPLMHLCKLGKGGEMAYTGRWKPSMPTILSPGPHQVPFGAITSLLFCIG